VSSDPIARLGKRIAGMFTLRAGLNENPPDQLRSLG